MKHDARKYCHIKGPFTLKNGGVLESPIIAFETWGTLNASKDNGVLIFTGLSPSAHAASSKNDPSKGWWEKMIGPNKPIDTERYFVICANSLGSCFGSTGPASIDPVTNKTFGLTFPKLALEDIGCATRKILDQLEINSLQAIIGPSMGGMTALGFLVENPDICKQLLLISTASTSRPFSIALRSLQRLMITSDPKWKSGNYDLNDLPLNGLRLARMLGMITYRSADEWNQRFSRNLVDSTINEETPFGAIDFQVEQYLRDRSDKFIQTFDPNSYLYLSRAIDLFDLGNYGESLTDLVNNFDLENVLMIGVNSDYIFPIDCQLDLYKAFQENGIDSSFIQLDSIQGHDSFLVDTENFTPPIRSFFN